MTSYSLSAAWGSMGLVGVHYRNTGELGRFTTKKPTLAGVIEQGIRACTHHSVHVEVSGHPVELVLSFYHKGPGNPTQSIRFGSSHLYSLSHLAGLKGVLITSIL